MTAPRYRTLRLLCGTQGEVAAKLGVHRVTVAKREAGTLAISDEAGLAILALRNQIAERKKVVGGGRRNATKLSGAGSQNEKLSDKREDGHG